MPANVYRKARNVRVDENCSIQEKIRLRFFSQSVTLDGKFRRPIMTGVIDTESRAEQVIAQQLLRTDLLLVSTLPTKRKVLHNKAVNVQGRTADAW